MVHINFFLATINISKTLAAQLQNSKEAKKKKIPKIASLQPNSPYKTYCGREQISL